MEVQITAFQAMWHLNPAAGTRELHTPPYHTPPDVETPRRIHAQLGDLNDQELRQLMWDLSQEIAQCKSTEPPSYPPPRDWACPSGNVVPEEDDREVTFPRGGRVPTGPQLPPTSPAPAGPVMGQLISALTSGLRIGTQKSAPLVAKRHPVRQKCRTSSGATRCSASRTTTRNRWSARVSCSL